MLVLVAGADPVVLEPVAAATDALLPLVVLDIFIEDSVVDPDPVDAALVVLPVAVDAQVEGKVVTIWTFAL